MARGQTSVNGREHRRFEVASNGSIERSAVDKCRQAVVVVDGSMRTEQLGRTFDRRRRADGAWCRQFVLRHWWYSFLSDDSREVADSSGRVGNGWRQVQAKTKEDRAVHSVQARWDVE